MEKIKKMSLRLPNGDFSSFYPFGADSINIDMLSGGNLEEELHLGSPNFVTFNTDDNGVTTITEEYKKNEDQDNNYYVMITVIDKNEDGETYIVQKLNFFKDGQLNLKKIKNITFSGSGNQMAIKEVIE